MKQISFFKWIFAIMYGFLPSSVGYSSVIPILSSPRDPLHPCDVAIGKVISAPNKWKLSCTWYPMLSTHGLTDRIDFEMKTNKFQTMTLSEAEKMYAEVIEEYIKEINKIKIIRPFLYEFPLTGSSIDVTIMFKNKNNQDLPLPDITTIRGLIGDSINFCQAPEKPNKFVVTVAKIPLSTISRNEYLFSPGIPRTCDEQKPQVPTYILSKDQRSPLCEFCIRVGQALCKRHNLIFVMNGFVTEKKTYGLPLDCVLRGYQKLLLDDARIMAADSSQFILKEYQKSKIFIDYLQERNTYTPPDHNGPIPESRHVGFRFSFWDEDINRRETPYIAEIRVEDNRFRYFTSDEGQRLVLVHEESFDEAMKFLEKNENDLGNSCNPNSVRSFEDKKS